MILKINKWMDRKQRKEKNGTAAKNKKKRKKNGKQLKREMQKRNALVGGMLDASNAPLHGRKRISDMNGNAKREQVFVLSKT